MIDPKLNEIPEKQRTAARPGLSVNDTIASDANLSVGGQGADVSGVRAGAGAGAGSSHVTPGRGSSATQVAHGPAGIGTTPMSEGVQGDSSRLSHDVQTDSSALSDSSRLSHDEIAQHAYRCWVERGCPHGSAEEDWHRAERELRERASSKASAAKA